ncbi:hypothetical protein SPHINGOAX6_50348 [Sphingomonas sp. AX6]|nr:hypothetical protein SPHINGOAX6_50348 [Sphingomonas sp. AX6]
MSGKTGYDPIFDVGLFLTLQRNHIIHNHRVVENAKVTVVSRSQRAAPDKLHRIYRTRASACWGCHISIESDPNPFAGRVERALIRGRRAKTLFFEFIMPQSNPAARRHHLKALIGFNRHRVDAAHSNDIQAFFSDAGQFFPEFRYLLL